MTLNFVVWKVRFEKLQRSSSKIVDTKIVFLRPKRPYSLLSFTDQPVFPARADSGGVVEVLTFFWTVPGQSVT